MTRNVSVLCRSRLLHTLCAAFGLFAIATSAAHAQDKSIVFQKDIEYANPDEQHLMVDMAWPKDVSKGPFPAVLCIHGGGFRAGDRHGYDGLVQEFAKRGYVAATVEYRLAPKYPFPAAIYDVKACVRWLRANARKLHIDPRHIGVTGGSAGGHLVQFLGVTADIAEFEGNEGNPKQSSAVQAVVNQYGPSDFTKSYGKSVDAAEVLPLWLGGDLKTALPRHIQSSPLNWVNPHAAPTLIIHGTKDNYVAYEQATWMFDRLKACGVPCELLTMEGAGHGFGGETARKADEAMFVWFDKYLKTGKQTH